ncbi:hypothetical protein DFH06DRAFT_1002715, partial [Mycena polygramma]
MLPFIRKVKNTIGHFFCPVSVVPLRGAWAVMTIDPVASLAHLNEPLLLKDGCPFLCNRSYVVYVRDEVHDGGVLRDPQPEYHDYTVEFLLQGLPPTNPAYCIDSAMSIPIFPAVKHPVRRAPLQPSSLLPWSNCYLSPFVAVKVRAFTAVSTDPVPHQLSIPEQLRHDTWFEDDQRRRAEGLA